MSQLGMTQLPMDYFEDNIVNVPSYQLPLWSVKRFYSLFVAKGLIIRNKARRKREMRTAVSTLIVIAMEYDDTLDEINRYRQQLNNQEDAAIEAHLDKLDTHLSSLNGLREHLRNYTVAYEHQRLD